MSANLEKVQEVVAKQLGKQKSEITPEKKFIDDLGADSLDLSELIMAFEEAFGVDEISDEDSAKFITVGDVVKYVDSL
ncbi:MAG: acyl carrier protein [Chitinispirillales bacterium]|jgi:acyl carrier protein|nr:acyl carrier protein [Chitinispirillales bacterium]